MVFDLGGLGEESEEAEAREGGGEDVAVEEEAGGFLGLGDLGVGSRKRRARADETRGRGEEVIARELSARVLRECQFVEAEAGDTHAAFVAALRRKFGELRGKVDAAEAAAKAAQDALEAHVAEADAKYVELESRVGALEKRAGREGEKLHDALVEENRSLEAACTQMLAEVESQATMFAIASQDYKALAKLVGNLIFQEL